MNAIQKVNYTHDAMIDLMLANPGISQNELAAYFGYTPSWVSLVKSSDAFRERLEARRKELVDPTVAASIEERFHALVEKSLEVLQEKLSMPTSQVPDQLALQAAALGARGLGKGGFGASGGQVNVQVNVSAEERLARVRDRIQGLVREKRGVEDAKIIEVGQAGQGSEGAV